MTKTFTSLVVVEFALNNHEAESKEHYIDILKNNKRMKKKYYLRNDYI